MVEGRELGVVGRREVAGRKVRGRRSRWQDAKCSRGRRSKVEGRCQNSWSKVEGRCQNSWSRVRSKTFSSIADDGCQEVGAWRSRASTDTSGRSNEVATVLVKLTSLSISPTMVEGREVGWLDVERSTGVSSNHRLRTPTSRPLGILASWHLDSTSNLSKSDHTTGQDLSL